MTDVMVELRAANPAPAEAEPHPAAWSDTALLAEIDTRSGIEMSLDQKPKTERANAVERPRGWSRGLVAAAAFAVVVGVIGVVALVDFGGTETTEPPATTAEPVVTTAAPTSTTVAPTTAAPALSADEQQFVEAYFDAWNNDVDAQLALLAPDVEIVILFGVWHPFAVDEPQSLERGAFEDIARWGAALDTRAEATECVPLDQGFRCGFTMTDVFLEGINSPLAGSMDIVLSDGLASLLSVRWTANNYYDQTGDFGTWLRENYSQHRSAMMIASGEPIFTSESAALWRQLAPRYVGADAPLTEEESAFVTEFFDAWNNDIEAYIALVAPGAVIEQVGEVKWEITVEEPTRVTYDNFAAKARFEAGIATRSSVDPARCLFRSGAISCPFVTTDILIEGTLKEVSGVVEIEVSDDIVHRLLYTWAFNPTAGVQRGFKDWLEANHPAAIIDGFDEFSPESAAVWVEYVPLFLEATRG